MLQKKLFVKRKGKNFIKALALISLLEMAYYIYIFSAKHSSKPSFLFSTLFLGPNNKLETFPNFRDGPRKPESEIKFEQKVSTITFYKDTGIESPLLYHKEHRPPEKYLDSNCIASYREKFTFYHLKNAFVSTEEMIGLPEGGYWDVFTKMKGKAPHYLPTVAGYKNIVFPILRWIECFGHFINEAVCSILSTPEWVWKTNPIVLIKCDHEWITTYMKILGLENIEIVQIRNAFVYGENIYVTRAFEDCHGFGIRAFPLLREKVTKYYNLDKIKPTDYFVGNKRPGRTRHITNSEEVREELIKATKLDWKVLKDDFSDRVACARTFASAKLIVMACGSMSFNVIYMKKFTGTVQLMANRIEFPSTRMSLMLGVWTLSVLHPNMQHFGGPGKANVPVIVESTKIVMYAIENGKWPKHSDDYHIGFNISLFKRFYEKNGDIWLDFDVVYPYDDFRISKYL